MSVSMLNRPIFLTEAVNLKIEVPAFHRSRTVLLFQRVNASVNTQQDVLLDSSLFKWLQHQGEAKFLLHQLE